MREVVPHIERWLADGKSIGLATTIQTWGSAPRGVGARMAFTTDGEIAGSVSGGCVEGAVIEVGRQVLKTGQSQLLHFGVADETAWDVGLACGGEINVFVQPLQRETYVTARGALAAEQPIAVATIVRGPDEQLGRELALRGDGHTTGDLGTEADESIVEAARAALEAGQARSLVLPNEAADIEVFIDVLLPAPTLIVVGGVHIAVALAAIAKTLGYRTVLVDPRRAFGNEARFPHVDRLIPAWPDEAFSQVPLTRTSAVATLTHDPKIDDPALTIALTSSAFYVGALGSRKTQAKRRERLQKAGLSEAQLARLHGPIGLDLGAQTPEEIALAVMAQIVAARNGRLADAG